MFLEVGEQERAMQTALEARLGDLTCPVLLDLWAYPIWLWVQTNSTIFHPFYSILVGIGMFTGGTGF